MAQQSAHQPGLMGFVHRRRRGAELFLLVLALAVGIGAYAAVGVGVQGEVPPDILGYGGWLLGLTTFGWPLVIGGGFKIVYDLLLLRMFRSVRPPEERDR